MGITKTDIFQSEELELAHFFKVLGHPARLAIIKAIVHTEGCVCGDLVSEIGLAQSTISQHLKELKAIGLIQGTIEGTSMCYCINEGNWNRYTDLVKIFLEIPDKRKNQCC